MTLNRPLYKQRPIGSVHALSRALGISVAELGSLAMRADGLYYVAKRMTKSDGGIRTVHGVREPLKSVQSRILKRILVRVDYPQYLMGGIRDPARIRCYRRNAQRHSSAPIIFAEDIENFYPSITERHVRDVVQYSLCCPPDVATLVAKLCTLRGRVAQGASTSTYVANLVLGHHEPGVVEALEMKGFRYTRYIDDIHVSSAMPVAPDRKQSVVSAMRRLIELSGFKPKRAKHEIATQGGRMRIHNLNVNANASIDSEKRKRIRAAVFQVEARLQDGHLGDDFEKALARATSYASELRALHPAEGARLMARLKTVRNAARGQSVVRGYTQEQIIVHPR